LAPKRIDVDMLSICENELDNDLKRVSGLDENTKGLVQYLDSFLHKSNHINTLIEDYSGRTL
jgi:hypothetical protein